MANLSQQSVHAGHTILLKIDGIEVGRAQSISGRRSFGVEGQYEIGSIMPQELVALKYDGSFQLEKYRVRRKSLFDLGLAAYGVGILNMGVIDIHITDRFTNDIVIIYRSCSISEQSEDFRANAFSGESATWMYLSADQGITESINPAPTVPV